MVATTPASFFTLKNVRVRSSRLATRATISVDLTFSQKTELSVCASGFKLASPRSGAQIWHSSTRAPGPDPAVAMAHIHRDDAEDRGGFNFDNVRRNEMLRGSGLAFKNAMKTARAMVMYCPMLASFFVRIRMRALQITQQTGSPQVWAQDEMYMMTWTVAIQFWKCFAMMFFSAKIETDEDGNEEPGTAFETEVDEDTALAAKAGPSKRSLADAMTAVRAARSARNPPPRRSSVKSGFGGK